MNTSPETKCEKWEELGFKNEKDCLDSEHSYLVGGKRRRHSTHKKRSHKRRTHRKRTHKRRHTRRN